MFKFCPNCGAKIVKQGKFCHECGYSLQGSNQDTVTVEKDIIIDEPDDIIMDNNDGGDFFGDFAQVQQEEDIKNNELAQKLERLFVNYKMNELIDKMSNIESPENPRLAYLAAMILEYGYGQVQQDGESAFNILAQLSDSGYILADLHLIGSGLYSINEEYIPILNKNISASINDLEKSEDPFIIHEVASYYCSENSNRVNYNKAVKLYQKAANKGYWKSCSSLGDIYLLGECRQSSNVNKAIQYYEKAAVKGERISALTLGRLYYFEKFIKRNTNKAKQWYLVAAEQNEHNALKELGNIFFEENDWYTAIKYYNQDIEVNNADDTAAELGSLYQEDDTSSDFPKDNAKAKKLYEKALSINSDNVLAAFGLGTLYLLDEDIKNDALAEKYLRKAANSDNSEISSYARDALKLLKESNNQQSEGCFITTAVCDSFNKPDNCYELEMFRSFRDNWLSKQTDGKQLIEEYYTIAPKIVEKINSLANAKEIYQSIWDNYLKECLRYLEQKNTKSCKKVYIDMVNNLKKIYL